MDCPAMIREIEKNTVSGIFPDATPCRILGMIPVSRIAERFGIPGRDVEIAALEREIVPERYIRNMKSFSCRDQAKLLKARVFVAGAGGLGGAVVEILAREGIGHLTIADGDRFEESNLNRQFLCTRKSLGWFKAESGARRVEIVNPSLTVADHSRFLNPDNAARLIADADVAVDCLDNTKTRFILEAACREAGIPMVSAAIAGETGHVTTIFPGDTGLAGIYGPPDQSGEKGAETALGCLSHAITILSALECAEVVKILLDRKNILRNRLLVMDLADYTFEVVETG